MTILNRDDLKGIVVPTVTQCLAFISISMLVLFLSNADSLFTPIASYVPSEQTRNGFNAVLHRIAGLASANTAVLVIFWALVGLAVYGVCWALYNSLTHAYNEAVIDTQFKNRGTWLEQLSPLLLQIFFGLATLGFVLASGWIAGTLSGNFATSLIGWQWSHLPKELVHIFLLALDLYTCWVLLRITFYVE